MCVLFGLQVILAAGSPYFRTMFASGMEESRKELIEMKQIDPIVFGQVLKFIYTGNVEIGGATVQDLFTQAHQFQISQLVESCVSFFQVSKGLWLVLIEVCLSVHVRERDKIIVNH